MSHRRILSLWFPRLGAERILRAERGDIAGPLVVAAEVSNSQVITALNAAAEAAGLHPGQSLRDAHAMCATLRVRSRNPAAEAAFLAALRRWAGRFTPWVAEAGEDGLTLDISGCAHLFGGETALTQAVAQDCADIGLSLHMGLADTVGAAWALARYGGAEPLAATGGGRSGDAIEQEARATRARAQKRRHWSRGGRAPQVHVQAAGETAKGPQARISAPGQTRAALAPLPVAALRLEAATVAQLNRLGLRRIGDLLAQPRSSLARRFGRGLVARLDQAMGSAPEPVSPAREPDHFAVRLTLPEPIGLMEDLLAALDRMLPRLCARLAARGKGARVLRLEAHRCDQAMEAVSTGLARASREPDRIRPLLAMKLEQIDAGFGIDMLRLEVTRAEAIHTRAPVGHLPAGAAARARQQGQPDGVALEDLVGRLGARLGLEAITRLHPADSHIPDKRFSVQAAAWSEPAAEPWPRPLRPRPLLLWPPERVRAAPRPDLPSEFRWRGRNWQVAAAEGPERIAPEWWLEDPNWRNGVRDYWVVVSCCGAKLWLFFAHGAALSPGWFCQGSFA